jgi:Ca2+-binding RTX toxin-like protein
LGPDIADTPVGLRTERGIVTINAKNVLGARRLGVAAGAAAALAVGMVAAGPAAAARSSSASVANDTLTVSGSVGHDRIALRLAPGAPGTLQVDFGDDGSAEHSFDRSTFTRVAVNMLSGNDQFRSDQVNGTFADEIATIDAGSGDDTMNGGDGNELFLGGSGDDALDGNRGADVGVLGSGSDSFRWDPGDGSDVVEGRSGTDTLDFNGAGVDESMSLSAEGRRAVFLRDPATIRMDMDGVERLDLTALGGADTLTVDDLTGTDFRRADVDLSAPTGGSDAQADTVTVNGTPKNDRIEVEAEGARVDVEGLGTEVRISGSEVIDRLQVNGLDGNDDVDVDDDVSELIAVAADLGPGQR